MNEKTFKLLKQLYGDHFGWDIDKDGVILNPDVSSDEMIVNLLDVIFDKIESLQNHSHSIS